MEAGRAEAGLAEYSVATLFAKGVDRVQGMYHSSYLPVLKPKGKGIETSWSRGIARELSVGKTQAMLLSLGGNPPDHKAYIQVGEDLRDPT